MKIRRQKSSIEPSLSERRAMMDRRALNDRRNDINYPKYPLLEEFFTSHLKRRNTICDGLSNDCEFLACSKDCEYRL